jgi:hypothetical protein
MSITETSNGGEQPRRFREGFVRAEGPAPEPTPTPAPEPSPPPQPPQPSQSSDTRPQDPLPTQFKLQQPVPEEPLSMHEQVRRDIAAEADNWPITVQLLYKPIVNEKGEELRALTFREPRAREINAIGNPTRMLWDSEIVIEERKMTYIMGALCGVAPPYLERMDPRDWNSCAYRLRKFFLPDLRAW